MMSRLDEYANKYQTIKLERQKGILQMTLHTAASRCAGGPVIQSEAGSTALRQSAPTGENRSSS